MSNVPTPPTPAQQQQNGNRIFYLNGPIDEAKAQQLVQSLIQLEQQNPLNDIVIYIDSYGGYVDSFIAIHDAMRMCRCDIATICVGKAMSAAQMILMSGTKGKRFITPNSRIMMHQLSSGAFGKLHEIDNEVEEMKRLQDVLDSIFLKYSKISRKDLRRLLERDTYLTPSEAIKLGIVDQIVTDPREFYKKVKL